MSYQLITASAHDTGLPDKSVHMIVTSPPYYGLRAYEGDQAVDWPTVSYSPMPGLPPITIPAMRCGLGAEPAPEAFIGHLILVAREMWRVLRGDGVMFWNIGDSYAGSGGAHTHDHANPGISKSADRDGVPAKYREDGGRGIDKKGEGIKPKDMMFIPARFALAAQADGWYLRSNMPWIKRNGMPDSTADRPSTVIENVFMLAKSEKYFFDMQAVRQPAAAGSNGSKFTTGKTAVNMIGTSQKERSEDGRRNFRSSDFFFRTWQGMLTNEAGPMAMVVNTKGYAAAHFATYPLDIPLTCIKAGSSEWGVCPECGAPWEREVERTAMVIAKTERNQTRGTRTGTSGTMLEPAKAVTTGWKPTCTCHVVPGCAPEDCYWAAPEPIPATVLDPFNGSGTTGRAALQLNRSYIGIDICKSYLNDLAPARLGNVQIEMSL